MLEKIFEGAIWRSRFIVVLAVIFGLLGAVVLFVVASLDIWGVAVYTFNTIITHAHPEHFHEDIVAGIIGDPEADIRVQHITLVLCVIYIDSKNAPLVNPHTSVYIAVVTLGIDYIHGGCRQCRSGYFIRVICVQGFAVLQIPLKPNTTSDIRTVEVMDFHKTSVLRR